MEKNNKKQLTVTELENDKKRGYTNAEVKEFEQMHRNGFNSGQLSEKAGVSLGLMFHDNGKRISYLRWCTDIPKNTPPSQAYVYLKKFQRLAGQPENQKRMQKVKANDKLTSKISLTSAKLPMVNKDIGITREHVDAGRYFFMQQDIKPTVEVGAEDAVLKVLSGFGKDIKWLKAFATKNGQLKYKNAKDKENETLTPFDSKQRIYTPTSD